MRQNEIYLSVCGEKFTDIRTQMAIAAERSEQIATVRYFTEKKITLRTAETSSLTFVISSPSTIFNLPGDLLSYHIDQSRAPRKIILQYENLLLFLPSWTFINLHPTL